MKLYSSLQNAEVLNNEQIKQKKVTKLEIYSDEKPRYTYDGIFATRDTNVKAYGTDWSTEAILEYYLKRDLQVTNQKDEKKHRELKEEDKWW